MPERNYTETGIVPTDDIVTRLREWGGTPGEGVNAFEDDVPKQMLVDAADEIERLRKAGDRVTAALNWHHDHSEYRCEDEYALSEWEEARRD